MNDMIWYSYQPTRWTRIKWWVKQKLGIKVRLTFSSWVSGDEGITLSFKVCQDDGKKNVRFITFDRWDWVEVTISLDIINTNLVYFCTGTFEEETTYYLDGVNVI